MPASRVPSLPEFLSDLEKADSAVAVINKLQEFDVSAKKPGGKDTTAVHAFVSGFALPYAYGVDHRDRAAQFPAEALRFRKLWDGWM